MGAGSSKHAFLSYVHEDAVPVDALDRALDAADIDVWRDTRDLWPGEDWKRKIRDAIRNGSLAFIACFSTTSVNKQKTFQNEEITLAIEEVRLRQPGAQWFFPVRLDDCEVPEFDLGAGRTLHSLQFTDLFGANAQINLVRLITAVTRLLEPGASAAQVAQAILATESGDSANLTDRVRTLLRDPQGDIRLEETVDSAAEQARDELSDPATFPQQFDRGASDVDAAISAQVRINETETALRPLTEVLILGATYGGPQHARIWTRAVEPVADLYDPSGQNLMVGLRQYPMVWLMHAVALASVDRNNFWALGAIASQTEVRVVDRSYPAIAVFSEARVFHQFEWLGSAIAMATDDANFVIDEPTITALRTRRLGSRHTPMSDVLHSHLRPFFSKLVRDDKRFEGLFDRASVVLDALAWDMRSQDAVRGISPWPGFGRYTWNTQYDPIEHKVAGDDSLKEAMVAAGLFGGELARCDAAFAGLVEHVEKVRHQRVW